MAGTVGWTKGIRLLSVAALLVGAAGCYQHVFVVGAGAPGGSLVHDEWRHQWLWGLVSPKNELAIREVCPSGNATILGEVTFLNGLVSALTGGIYSPTTVRVRCTGGSASLDVRLSADDVSRIVAAPGFLQWVGEMAPDRLDDAARAQRDLSAD
jgi:Bor protein